MWASKARMRDGRRQRVQAAASGAGRDQAHALRLLGQACALPAARPHAAAAPASARPSPVARHARALSSLAQDVDVNDLPLAGVHGVTVARAAEVLQVLVGRTKLRGVAKRSGLRGNSKAEVVQVTQPPTVDAKRFVRPLPKEGADGACPEADGFCRKPEGVTHKARLPEHPTEHPRTVRPQQGLVLCEDDGRHGAVPCDRLAECCRGHRVLQAAGREEEEGEAWWAALHGPPQISPAGAGLAAQPLQAGGVAHQRVEPGLQALHPVHGEEHQGH
mmetsp:Transcript_101907/g.304067  ORF Transcript_101907/g.304067 Transcript_101907/m.304067 type:complete len:275 (+) Transcript_101907:327-1151(+)